MSIERNYRVRDRARALAGSDSEAECQQNMPCPPPSPVTNSKLDKAYAFIDEAQNLAET